MNNVYIILREVVLSLCDQKPINTLLFNIFINFKNSQIKTKFLETFYCRAKLWFIMSILLKEMMLGETMC
jgi:hypothetical protein